MAETPDNRTADSRTSPLPAGWRRRLPFGLWARQAPGTEPDRPDAIAAVDLGSNSFHMVVARVVDGQPQLVDRVSEMVRLAGGLTDDKRITPDVQERALACLERFRQRLAGIPPDAVRAVGTNTMRSIDPDCGFLAAAEAALGLPIEVISGVEEARLIYSGVSHSLDVDRRRLVMDIGGGSTELIVGEGGEPLFLESLYMGCVNMTRRHFADGAIGEAQLKRADVAARRELAPVAALVRGLGWEQAVGASGTFKALDRAVRESGMSGEGITPDALERLKRRMLAAGHVEKLDLPGINPTRAAVLPGGMVIARALMDALGVKLIAVAPGAMREGLLHDLIGRGGAADVRERTVTALAQRYHVDAAHAGGVEATAQALLAQVAEGWGLDGAEPVRFLSWAARLHEIGRDIAHSGYHKHGEYVLANADMPGFSRREQVLLACLVRAHRRKFPQAVLREKLPAPWDDLVRRLAVVLRLAVILHRGRGAGDVPEVALRPDKAGLDVRFPEGWLEGHPLTMGDLEAEAALLGAAGLRLSYG